MSSFDTWKMLRTAMRAYRPANARTRAHRDGGACTCPASVRDTPRRGVDAGAASTRPEVIPETLPASRKAVNAGRARPGSGAGGTLDSPKKPGVHSRPDAGTGSHVDAG